MTLLWEEEGVSSSFFLQMGLLFREMSVLGCTYVIAGN
jgi:hypothetical protein